MYKLNDIPNNIKDYINLYKKEKRNSIDQTKLSRNIINSRKTSFNSENSYKKIQKIKDILPQKNNNCRNIKDLNSFKNRNLPLCLSFMTNTNNYIKSIKTKFRIRNLSNIFENKTISDNISSIINNNSNLNSQKKEENKRYKNIFNLKLMNNKKSKEIRQIMSKINFSINKNRKYSEENSNSSVKIKNYNYFIGNIDKSLNIFDQKQIFEKDVKIQNMNKKNIKLNELAKPKPKIKYYDIFLDKIKLNLPKKKIQNMKKKKIILNNLNTFVDTDIINKETSINDSTKTLKIPKINVNNNNNNKTEKKEEKEKEEKEEENIIPEKKLEKIEISGLNDNNNMNSKSKVAFVNVEKDKEKNEKMKSSGKLGDKINKKSRRSSIFEINIKKRIIGQQKKNENRKKIKYSSIVIKNYKKKDDDEKNNFLDKIIEENDLDDILKPKKILKDSKIQIISYTKNRVNKLVSNKNEIIKFNYFSSYADMLSMRKNIMSSKTRIIIYKSAYFENKKNSILNILLYSYISIINRCSLDINLKTYIFSDLDFSSLNLPEIEGQEDSIQKSIVLNGISKRSNKKKEIFSTVKTKFIENNKYRYNKNTHICSLNFITKELEFYNVLKTINYLDNEKDINENTYSPIRTKSNNLKRKKTMNYSIKKGKYIRKFSSTISTNKPSKSLCILEDKTFFKKTKGEFLKRFRNSINANLFWYKINSKTNFKKILANTSKKGDYSIQKDYEYMNKIISLIQTKKFKNGKYNYNKIDLLKNIKEKQNIETILRLFIIEGETMFFIEYFNMIYKRIDINCIDYDGNTFLILSVKQGMNYLSKFLLERGVNTNIQNNEGNSAMHYALSMKNFNLADLLKKFGAQEDLINKKGYSPWECLGKSIGNIDE